MIALPPWYAKVPKDPIANRCWRIDVLREAAGSQRAREYLKTACKDDTLFYFNGFYWTYDPRLPDGDKLLPFITFPEFQDQAILEVEASIDKGRDLVLYKSRDLGLSWIILGVFEKKWHFLRDQTFLMIARDKDEVDSPHYPDALFQKIDRIHQHMPEWLMPKGWVPRQHRLRYSFFNPEFGCTINGEATIAAGGVGGRRTAVAFDEFSRIEQAAELDFGTADVSNCRIFNFTAYGTGNHAYDLMKRESIHKIGLYWYMDPRKNKKLYKWDGEEQRMHYFQWNGPEWKLERCPPHQYGPEDADTVNFHEGNGHPKGRPFEPVRDGVLRSPVYDIEDTRRDNRRYMAINWDIDFSGSDDRFFDTEMLKKYDRDLCVPPMWEGEIEVDQPTGEMIGLRESENGPLRLWFNPNDGWPRSDKGFAAGVDTSHGKGASNSCAMFANVDSGHKVAEYVTPFEAPELFAAKVVSLCKLFTTYGNSPAFLAWERIGPGEHFGQTVLELDHYHVYYDGQKPGEEIKPGRKAGWTPNRNSIRALLGEYDVALRQRQYINRSSLAIRECERFVKTPTGVEYQVSGGRGVRAVGGAADASGAREEHGDRPVADALCVRAIKFLGGGGAAELAKKKPPDPSLTPGTFQWRMRMHEQRDRDREEAWQ